MKKRTHFVMVSLLMFVAIGAFASPASAATSVAVTLSPTSVNAGETTTATIVFTSDTASDTLIIDTSSSAGQIAQPQLFNGGWLPSCSGVGTSQVTCPYALGSYPVTVTAVITVPASVTDTSWTVGALMVSDGNLDLATLAITPVPPTTTTTASTTTTTTSTSTTTTTTPGSTSTSTPSSSTTSASTSSTLASDVAGTGTGAGHTNGDPLATTGSSGAELVPFALGAIVIGLVLTTLARRRLTHGVR